VSLWSERWYLWEEVHARASRLWCRLFGHSLKRVEKMWCSLCARCSGVVEEKPRQMVLPAQRYVRGDVAVTYSVTLPSTEALGGLDRMMGRMRELLSRAGLTPTPPLRVERSDLLEPDAWANIGDRTVLGRFAWWRLMRTVRAPWPEDFLTPDADYPRDAPPT